MNYAGVQANDRLDINLTPLLDLVLQLIMFFMLTLSFVQVDRISEEVDLPVVQLAMPLLPDDARYLYITIGKNGERHVGETALNNANQLRDYVHSRKQEINRAAQARGQNADVGIIVVVRADKDAAWGDVWDTLEECSRAGCPRWQLRVVKQGV